MPNGRERADGRKRGLTLALIALETTVQVIRYLYVYANYRDTGVSAREKERSQDKTKWPEWLPLRGASGHAAHGGIVGVVVAIVRWAIMPGGPC